MFRCPSVLQAWAVVSHTQQLGAITLCRLAPSEGNLTQRAKALLAYRSPWPEWTGESAWCLMLTHWETSHPPPAADPQPSRGKHTGAQVFPLLLLRARSHRALRCDYEERFQAKTDNEYLTNNAAKLRSWDPEHLQPCPCTGAAAALPLSSTQASQDGLWALLQL